MTPLEIILLIAAVIFFLAMCTALRGANRWYNSSLRYKGWWEEEQNDRERDQHDTYIWRQRYESLLREYNELAELDEGEDYVRESLGYPPDEDDKESA